MKVWGLCLFLQLHSPNGEPFWVRAQAIDAIKPGERHQDHLAKGTHSIIYGQSGKPYAVRETPDAIAKMLNDCKRTPP